jgi:hypothetical protein
MLNAQEHLAITQQMKELGWIEWQQKKRYG